MSSISPIWFFFFGRDQFLRVFQSQTSPTTEKCENHWWLNLKYPHYYSLLVTFANKELASVNTNKKIYLSNWSTLKLPGCPRNKTKSKHWTNKNWITTTGNYRKQRTENNTEKPCSARVCRKVKTLLPPPPHIPPPFLFQKHRNL